MKRRRAPWSRKKNELFDPAEDDAPIYVYPVPKWKRVIHFPRDFILLHIDLIKAVAFLFWNAPQGKPSCAFCGDPANFDQPVKRCLPSTRYANLGIARTLCPCVQPPSEEISDIPFCTRAQRPAFTLSKLLLPGMILLLFWSSVGVGLYNYYPTRLFVARLVKSRAMPKRKIKKREYNPEKAQKKLAQAKELIEEKRWSEARIATLNARAYDPDNVEIRRTLGELYLALRQIPAALREFEKCFELDPNELKNFLNFSVIAIASRQHELLVPHIDTVPANINANPSFKIMSARVRYLEGNLDQARNVCMEVIAHPDASLNDLLETATLLLFQLSKPHAGVEALETALKIAPDSEQVLILLARAHRMQNNLGEAEKYLQRAESLGSTNPHMLIERAEQYVNAHRLEDAILNFEYISGRSANLSIARARLAELYLSTNQKDEAKKIADKLIEVPELGAFGQGHTVLAEIAMSNRFYGDAITHAAKAIEAIGETYGLNILLARAHLARKEVDKAIEYIEKATNLNPAHPDGQLTRAAIYLDQGDSKQGLRVLREIEKLPDMYPHQLMQLGELAARSGNFREARNAFVKLLQKQPDNLLVLNRITDVLETEGKEIAIARKLAERLATKLPDNTAVAQTLGRILLRCNKLEEDLPILEEHVEKFPFSAILHAQLGQCYFELGRKEDARKHLEESIKRAYDFSGIDEVHQMIKQLDTQ